MMAIVEAGVFLGVLALFIVRSAGPLAADGVELAWLLANAGPLVLCSIAAFYYNDLYDLRVVRNLREFTSRLPQAFGVTFILVAVFYAVFPDTQLPRDPFVGGVIVFLAVLVPLRGLAYRLTRSQPFLDRVLVLGSGPLARKLLHEIAAAPHNGYTVVGVVEDADAAPLPARYPSVGTLERFAAILAEVRPHRIVVALSERRGRLPVRQLLDARAQGVAVEDGVELYERLTGKLAIESLTPSNLIFSKDFKKSRLELAAGRLVSICVAAAGLVATAPALALIALAVKLDSRGPVFFVQERVGKDGKPFRLIKFRTMRPLEGPSSEWVRDNTHRVTRVGKILRKFRLDELPQFVNILRGDLNLVGPRPHPVSNFDLFMREIPYYGLRSVVRPGVTGWAQVRYGYANDLAEETEKMRYDLYFIKHLSLWIDILILVDTVKTVFFGRGATTTTVSESLTPHGAHTA
jgi:exopolysaccharide biosynthesis polyprenyl glycosylphosphotransferase